MATETNLLKIIPNKPDIWARFTDLNKVIYEDRYDNVMMNVIKCYEVQIHDVILLMAFMFTFVINDMNINQMKKWKKSIFPAFSADHCE